MTSYVEGVRGDLLVSTLDHEDLARLGADVGRIGAALASVDLPTPGLFVDADLTVEPFAGTLPEWVTSHALELDGLLDVAEEAEARLAEVARVSFVHSDLNPKNLIVDPSTLRVAAVLDWEFAHAGSPYTDLGNAVRFGRQPAWVDAVVAAYDDPSALDLARRADLWALVDLVGATGRQPRRSPSPRAAARDRGVAQGACRTGSSVNPPLRGPVGPLTNRRRQSSARLGHQRRDGVPRPAARLP